MRKTYKVEFRWQEVELLDTTFDCSCQAYIFTPGSDASVGIVRAYHERYPYQVNAILKKAKNLLKKHGRMIIDVEFSEGEDYRFIRGYRYILDDVQTRLLHSTGGDYFVMDKTNERDTKAVLRHLQEVLWDILREAQRCCWDLLTADKVC